MSPGTEFHDTLVPEHLEVSSNTNEKLLIIACRDANRIVFQTNTMNMKFEYLAKVWGTRDLDHLLSRNTEEVS